MLNDNGPRLSLVQIKELFKLLELPPERVGEKTLEGYIYIPCPFEHLHTKPTKHTDCRLYFDTHPHLHCFHDSCAEELHGLNDYLRLVITGTSAFPSKEDEGREPVDLAYRDEVLARKSEFLRKYRRRRRKQGRIEIRPADFLSRAFGHVPEKLIWSGVLTSTGSLAHRANFRTVEEWLGMPPAAGWSFTCPSTFVRGSFNRNDAHVDSLEYLVLESDDLSPEDTAAMFEWLEATFATPLWAIVHSGRRGPHGWFYPILAVGNGFDFINLLSSRPGSAAGRLPLVSPCGWPGKFDRTLERNNHCYGYKTHEKN